jgi:hypothetical protein
MDWRLIFDGDTPHLETAAGERIEARVTVTGRIGMDPYGTVHAEGVEITFHQADLRVEQRGKPETVAALRAMDSYLDQVRRYGDGDPDDWPGLPPVLASERR